MRARIIINKKEDKRGSKNICLVNYRYVIIIIYNIFVVILFSDLFVIKHCNKCIMSKVNNFEDGIK